MGVDSIALQCFVKTFIIAVSLFSSSAPNDPQRISEAIALDVDLEWLSSTQNARDYIRTIRSAWSCISEVLCKHFDPGLAAQEYDIPLC